MTDGNLPAITITRRPASRLIFPMRMLGHNWRTFALHSFIAIASISTAGLNIPGIFAFQEEPGGDLG